jgi:hypothetical protein
MKAREPTWAHEKNSFKIAKEKPIVLDYIFLRESRDLQISGQ